MGTKELSKSEMQHNPRQGGCNRISMANPKGSAWLNRRACEIKPGQLRPIGNLMAQLKWFVVDALLL